MFVCVCVVSHIACGPLFRFCFPFPFLFRRFAQGYCSAYGAGGREKVVSALPVCGSARPMPRSPIMRDLVSVKRTQKRRLESALSNAHLKVMFSNTGGERSELFFSPIRSGGGGLENELGCNSAEVNPPALTNRASLASLQL